MTNHLLAPIPEHGLDDVEVAPDEDIVISDATVVHTTYRRMQPVVPGESPSLAGDDAAEQCLDGSQVCVHDDVYGRDHVLKELDTIVGVGEGLHDVQGKGEIVAVHPLAQVWRNVMDYGATRGLLPRAVVVAVVATAVRSSPLSCTSRWALISSAKPLSSITTHSFWEM